MSPKLIQFAQQTHIALLQQEIDRLKAWMTLMLEPISEEDIKAAWADWALKGWTVEEMNDFRNQGLTSTLDRGKVKP